MYHRIDKVDTNPWGICVEPNHFEEQVKFLKKDFNVIGIAELIEQIKSNEIINNSICITFDDGYADNFTIAKPVLEQNNCAATFFISTAFLNEAKNFWWDELEILFLHSKKLPSNLSLKIAGKNYNYVIDETNLTEKQYQQHKKWNWYDIAPTTRCKVFLAIWKKLKPLQHTEIQFQIDTLKKWAGINTIEKNRFSMSREQLSKLSSNKLFSVEMHTNTHIDLKGKSKEIQMDELLTSQQILRNSYNIDSSLLSYPYGSFDKRTLYIVKQLNIQCCFTTQAFAVNANTNLCCMGRYQVGNWNLKTFKSHLENWCLK